MCVHEQNKEDAMSKAKQTKKFMNGCASKDQVVNRQRAVAV